MQPPAPGGGSGQHLASVLQEGRENANVDAGLGFIWRISVKSQNKSGSVNWLTFERLKRCQQWWLGIGHNDPAQRMGSWKGKNNE